MTSKIFTDQSKNAFADFITGARNLQFEPADQERLIDAACARIAKLALPGELETYQDYLEAQPLEFKQLLTQMFEHKSGLLNERGWTELRSLLASQPLSLRNLRVWLIGCGDGIEAYEAAISFVEMLGSDAADRLKIFATETDETKLAAARIGSYSRKHLENVLPPNLVTRYFSSGDAQLTFRHDLRRSIIFGKHDVSLDAPISRVNVLVCRQVLSFLSQDMQTYVARNLLQALAQPGYLILDRRERLPSTIDAVALEDYPNIYQRRYASRKSRFKAGESVEEAGNAEAKMIDLSVDGAPLASVCIDSHGVVASANARARMLFGISLDDIGKPLQDLQFSYRPVELRSMIESAFQRGHEVRLNRVVNGGQPPEILDIYVTPLYGPERARLGANIQCHEVTAFHGLQEELTHLNQQLLTANDKLQSASEELETTNEELHSTNEELETTNEELQSTNEELETMNEELQSTNAELEFTYREQRELASTVDRVNDFLEAILASMHSSVIVTDKQNAILVWNQRSEELWGLRLDEVKGQNLLQLDIGLPVHSLEKPLSDLQHKLCQRQDLLLDAVNRRGRSIKCRVLLARLPHDLGTIIVVDAEEAADGKNC